MPQPAARRAIRCAGFTLVELMVTLVLIGLLGALVALTSPVLESPAERAATRLAAAMTGARDEALLSARAVRLRLDAEGYRFEQRDFEGWQRIDDAPLAAQHWPGGVRPQLGHGEQAVVLQWDAQGSPSETLDDLWLADDRGRVQVRLRSDGHALAGNGDE
ncbi:GspH/FimT family pseudopilin [Luteimonas sp. e5]